MVLNPLTVPTNDIYIFMVDVEVAEQALEEHNCWRRLKPSYVWSLSEGKEHWQWVYVLGEDILG